MNFSAEEAGTWDRAFDPLASSIQGPTFSEFRSERGESFEKGTSPGRPGEVPVPFDRHVPGSNVEPLDPKHVLRSLVSEIFRCPQLGAFAKSCLRKAEPGEASGGDFRRPRDGAWPMPVPYPGIFRKNALSLCKDELKKLVVNAQVILLNYLDLGRPTRAPAACREGLALTGVQWEAVMRFERFLDAWLDLGILSASDMGRTAGKIEDLESLLLQLKKRVLDCGCFSQKHGSVGLGRLRSATVGSFKQVEPDRLHLRGFPEFDPRPFLDETARSIYETPFESIPFFLETFMEVFPESECTVRVRRD